MAGMIMCVDLGAEYVEIDGGVATMWVGEGPSVFTGTLDELNAAHPGVVQQLITKEYIHRSKNGRHQRVLPMKRFAK